MMHPFLIAIIRKLGCTLSWQNQEEVYNDDIAT